jgi:NAD-dependent dihydropyrimidine dehydrogenase PreA subunit
VIAMPYVIAEPCIDIMDRSCVEECPVDCIYQGDRKMYINPLECIDCGQCETVCPVSAISLDRNIPAEFAAHAVDNARFFAEPLPGHSEPVGQPGGADDYGPVGVDTELVSGVPLRSRD